MKKAPTSRVLPFTVMMYAPTICFADNQSHFDIVDSFDASSTICMSIGLLASISDLDDLELALQLGADGAAGSIYEGTEQFHLQSNGAVAVIIESNRLYQQNHSINVEYEINNESRPFITQEGQVYSNDLTLYARSRLGTISSQLAGDYEGIVTLTVTPATGGMLGCGATEAHYPDKALWATLAWEDLYPNPGDADYNDIVVNFRIEENYASDGQLETVHMDFIPVARGAGYNHKMLISLDGEIDQSNNINVTTTPALLTDSPVLVTYKNLATNTSHTRTFDSSENVVIFDSTRQAMGAGFANVYENADTISPRWMTSIDINLTNDDNMISNGLISGAFNYRPYIHVNNTNMDIDLYQVNAENGMVDANGYPFGLIVPVDWSWPNERVHIDTVYPHFEEYRQWLIGDIETLSTTAQFWYDYPATGATSTSSNINQ